MTGNSLHTGKTYICPALYTDVASLGKLKHALQLILTGIFVDHIFVNGNIPVLLISRKKNCKYIIQVVALFQYNHRCVKYYARHLGVIQNEQYLWVPKDNSKNMLLNIIKRQWVSVIFSLNPYHLSHKIHFRTFYCKMAFKFINTVIVITLW